MLRKCRGNRNADGFEHVGWELYPCNDTEKHTRLSKPLCAHWCGSGAASKNPHNHWYETWWSLLTPERTISYHWDTLMYGTWCTKSALKCILVAYSFTELLLEDSKSHKNAMNKMRSSILNKQLKKPQRQSTLQQFSFCSSFNFWLTCSGTELTLIECTVFHTAKNYSLFYMQPVRKRPLQRSLIKAVHRWMVLRKRAKMWHGSLSMLSIFLCCHNSLTWIKPPDINKNVQLYIGLYVNLKSSLLLLNAEFREFSIYVCISAGKRIESKMCIPEQSALL